MYTVSTNWTDRYNLKLVSLLFEKQEGALKARCTRPSHGKILRIWEIKEKNGWGGRIRTCAWRYQKPLPYRLATPHQDDYLR